MENKKIVNNRQSTFVKDVTISNKVFKNFTTNFFSLGSFYFKSLMKEWVLWICLLILMFALPCFFTYLQNQHLEDPQNQHLEDLNYFIPLNFVISHAFLVPLLFITIVMVPLFYSKLIEYNNIKRIGCAGITKEQFSLIIGLVNLIIISFLSFVAFYPINQFFLHIFRHSKTKSVVIYYNQLKWGFFLPTYLLSIILFTQVGLLFATKIKGVKSTLVLGIVIYLSLFFLMDIDLGGWNVNVYFIKNPTIQKVLVCVRWLWTINPLTWVIQGLLVAPKYAGFVTNESSGETNENLRIIVQILGIVSAFISPIILFLRTKRYIQFQSLK